MMCVPDQKFIDFKNQDPETFFRCRHNLKDGRPSNRGHVMIGSF